MNRRQFLKGVCGVVGAVILPLPKIAAKAVAAPLNGSCTLIELARKSWSGNLLDIVEVLSETNKILADAVWENAKRAYR